LGGARRFLRPALKKYLGSGGKITFLPIDNTATGIVSFKHKTKKEVACMEAYCVKCRSKKEMKDAKSITMKNGKPATQGVCPTCGTKMFRIGKG
jgi:hypothetical protein